MGHARSVLDLSSRILPAKFSISLKNRVRICVTVAVLLMFVPLLLSNFDGNEGNGDGNILDEASNNRSLSLQCANVIHVSDQCSYVRTHCSGENSGHLPYLRLYYCSLTKARPIAMLLFVGWFLLLASTTGTAASDFLGVNFSTIASILKLPDSFAGVTIFAVSNGASDILSAIVALKSNHTQLGVGLLVGGALFLPTVVVGAMALASPFKVAIRHFFRDATFLLVVGLWCLLVFKDGRLSLPECTGFICLYVIYVGLTIFWHWYLKARRKRREDEAVAREFYAPGLDVSTEGNHLDQPGPSENTPLLRNSGDSGSGKAFRDKRRKWSSIRAWSLLRKTVAHEIDEATEEDEQVREEQRQFTEIKDFMRVTGGRALTFRAMRRKSVPISLLRAFEYRTVSFSQRNSLARASLYGAFPQPNLRPFNDSFHYRHTTRRPSESYYHSTTGHQINTSNSSWDGVGDASVAPGDIFNTMRIRVDHRSRMRSTKAVIRPSLVGSLEFRSVLKSLSRMAPSSRQLRSENSLQTAQQQHHSLFTIPEALVAEPSELTEDHRGHEHPDGELEGAPNPFTSNSNYGDTILVTPPAEYPNHDNVLSAFYISTLFPTMASWSDQALTEKLLAVCSIPSVFLLIITCPVAEIVSDDNDLDKSTKDPAPSAEEADGDIQAVTPMELGQNLPNPEGPKALAGTLTILPVDTLVAWSSSGTILHGSRQDLTLFIGPEETTPTLEVHRTLSDEEITWALPSPPVDLTLADPGAKLDRHQTFQLIQLFFGPTLLGLAFFLVQLSQHEPSILTPMIGIGCGVCLAAVYWALHPLPMWFTSFVGSLVAILWIFLLVRETVGVLTAFDIIVKSGDMVIGLSVFAVANSLGDLVADLTVARLGYPVMALSACFGGPITQITMGLGFGGLYKILSDSGRDDQAKETPSMSRTIPVTFNVQLIVSLGTLVSSLAIMLIGVPLNDQRLDRKFGLVLICLWTGAITANIALEIVAR